MYNYSFIYRIFCKDENINDTYIGSTIHMADRPREHKRDSKKEIAKDSKLQTFVRDNKGWDNFDFEVIELYNCENRSELIRREGYWAEKLKPTLNCARFFGIPQPNGMTEWRREYKKLYGESYKY